MEPVRGAHGRGGLPPARGVHGAELVELMGMSQEEFSRRGPEKPFSRRAMKYRQMGLHERSSRMRICCG